MIKNPEQKKKKALALQVIERLKKEYPDTHCTLSYEDAWQLLISVRLAAQCTDLRVDQVTPKLYERFPTVAALAAAPVEEIEKIVHPCGLGPSKARDIKKCMTVLHETYGDRVPDDFDALLSLPGVGRKSANLVMGDVFGKPAIVTDTHCIRLCNLIGLVDDVKEPAKVEKLLWEIIPPEEGNQLCHRFVDHGRAVCVARRPQCDVCCLNDICRYATQEKTVADSAGAGKKPADEDEKRLTKKAVKTKADSAGAEKTPAKTAASKPARKPAAAKTPAKKPAAAKPAPAKTPARKTAAAKTPAKTKKQTERERQNG